MKKLAIIILLSAVSAGRATLVDLTPGGFTPSIDGSGDPPAYQKVFNNLDLGSALISIFNQGPYQGLGGTYLFSNLFDISPTAGFAQVSWNLTGQPDGDWMTYIRVIGSDNAVGIENIYQVVGGRLVGGPLTVNLDGKSSGEIAIIQFMGRNPAYPTPDAGSTCLLVIFALLILAAFQAYNATCN